MFIPRDAAGTVESLARTFPAVVITGPRQSGKTTLARHVFPTKPYVSLEDLDEQAFADEDPRGFLDRFPDGALLDEVQRAPRLFSYLQTRLDQDGRMGQFVLTGSQQFGLLTGITQSLAGRTALLSLLPLGLGELQRVQLAPRSLDVLLLAGSYPAIYDRGIDPPLWYGNYVRTYVERDVRQLVNVRDLSAFQRFLRLCAGRTGQLLNLSDLASDCGVTHTTARSWISVLEASYVIHLLKPHHRNFNKRIIKTPKLYFCDSGLACHLLGIEQPDQLAVHPQRGALFETWVVSEMLKHRLNRARSSNLFFWRDRSGNEIDVLVDRGDRLEPVEIKSGQTVASDFATGLRRWLEMAGEDAARPWLVFGGRDSVERGGISYVTWSDLPARLAKDGDTGTA